MPHPLPAGFQNNQVIFVDPGLVSQSVAVTTACTNIHSSILTWSSFKAFIVQEVGVVVIDFTFMPAHSSLAHSHIHTHTHTHTWQLRSTDHIFVEGVSWSRARREGGRTPGSRPAMRILINRQQWDASKFAGLNGRLHAV